MRVGSSVWAGRGRGRGRGRRRAGQDGMSPYLVSQLPGPSPVPPNEVAPLAAARDPRKSWT